MDSFEFNLLNPSHQASYICEHGTYLAVREVKGYKVNLYHVDQFFVEVWCDAYKNDVKEIRSLRTSHCLEPYLESIIIDI